MLQRVCTVSVKTMDIVDGMAYWEDGYLIVFGDRDKHEWAMLGLSQWFGGREQQEWENAALEAFNSYYDESDDDPEYQAWLASLPDIREQRE